MKHGKVRFSLVGVLCVVLVSTQASAQFVNWGRFGGASPWEIYTQAGAEAYQRVDLAEAEKQFSAALREAEKFGPEDPRRATSLNNLAGLYHSQGKYAEAESLYRWALAILEKALGPEHPQVATSLNNLAGLYHSQGKYAEAEPLFQRAVLVWEKALGPEHLNVATTLKQPGATVQQAGQV